MKIIAASFQCESNSRAALRPGHGDFEYCEGEDIFKKMPVKEYLVENGFEVVPSVYACALPSGNVEEKIYRFYADKILKTVSENADADGIFLFLHGSMEVDGIGSGELCLLKAIRRIVPRSCLIALALDLHANVTDELAEYADIVCAFKTAPHVDQKETQLRAVKALAFCLKNSVRPKTFFQRIPMLVKGDTMLTSLEPLKTLEEATRRLEDEPDVFGANLFFGHCWVDAPNTSASAVVSAAGDRAERLAKDLADRLWNTRKEYRFTIEAQDPEESVRRALSGTEKRIFLTDSGDNTTAGAEGDRTDILALFVNAKPEKAVCVAGITNETIVKSFWDLPDGKTVTLPLFGGIEANVKVHGKILGWAKDIIGRSLTFSIGNIDAIFTERRAAFIEKGNFDLAGVDLEEYRVVVVKLGYLFAELKPYADREIFVLSDGASCVELSRLGLKKIIRPLYPLEDFTWSAN
ncbi:MAG: M81 family metallopeptidase [Clostridia bacterium]|nr:M81 family metallopeptidase [Clostridia bacterium]